MVRRIIAVDTEAADLLDRALQQKHGGDRTKGAISNVAQPTGTTKDAALRRLRKDRPDLHADVTSWGIPTKSWRDGAVQAASPPGTGETTPPPILRGGPFWRIAAW